MKQYPIISCILVIIATVCANAQTVQLGVVKEYNERAQKTPLAGVELNVRSAQSTVSDKKGYFSLNFLSLKPGEKINVRRIEKLGYEVFNKEAIEQWNLNPTTPFLIVMCRSDRFKKIRDNYEKVSSESYARQFKKEEEALAKLKADGKIKEDEYQKKLYELQDNYEKQLDNLESYVDRFSRIDLSELSDIEQKIIELIEHGKFEEAIVKYDELELEEKLLTALDGRDAKIEAAQVLIESAENDEEDINSLYEIIYRKVETLKMAGGTENFRKAANMLKTIADRDSTNIDLQYRTSFFLKSLFDYHSALKYINRYLLVELNQ